MFSLSSVETKADNGNGSWLVPYVKVPVYSCSFPDAARLQHELLTWNLLFIGRWVPCEAAPSFQNSLWGLLFLIY